MIVRNFKTTPLKLEDAALYFLRADVWHIDIGAIDERYDAAIMGFLVMEGKFYLVPNKAGAFQITEHLKEIGNCVS